MMVLRDAFLKLGFPLLAIPSVFGPFHPETFIEGLRAGPGPGLSVFWSLLSSVLSFVAFTSK